MTEQKKSNPVAGPGPSANDKELTLWREAWQRSEAGGGSESDIGDTWGHLARQVRRRSLGLLALTVGEILFSLAMAGFLLHLGWLSPDPLNLAFVGCMVLLLVLLEVYVLWNRRGMWRPAGEAPGAYLDLSRRRLVRRRQSLRIARYLLGVEGLLFIPWIFHRLHQASGVGLALAYTFLVAWLGLFAVILVVLEFRTRREEEELEAIAGELEAGPP